MKKTLMIATSLLVSGCVTTAMQNNQYDSFETHMSGADYLQASIIASDYAELDDKTGQVDDLLWAMQTGAALRFNGQYQESIKYFDAAEHVMKSEDTESGLEKGAETAGSMLGNDAMMDYEQTQYDGVMANTYKAWSFWQAGDMQNARIEFNRATDRQRRAAEYFAEEITEQKEAIANDAGESSESVKQSINSPATQKILAQEGFAPQWQAYEGYINPYTTYSNGLFFMLNGQSRADYQKAVDSFKRVYSITQSAAVKTDLQMAQALAKGESPAKFKQGVWVVFENGQSAVREEKRLDLPLAIFKNSNVKYTGIALPRLKARSKAYENITVAGYKTQEIADIDKIIGAEFDQEFPYILAREITRVTLKTVAQAQIEKNDDTGIGGLVAGIAQAATTGADIRTFSALPAQYQLTRFEKTSNQLDLQIGQYSIPVTLSDDAKHHIIYVKAITATTEPRIDIINI